MRTGQILGGRYRLADLVGSGGMATVWRAHDEVLDRMVAVKVLAGRYCADPRSRDRIRVEARAAASLSHPNVTGVHDFGESIGDKGVRVPYVVMELLSGWTVAQRLASGPIPPRVALRVCSEVAAGLAAAHARGLVHRDVKPANVMLTAAGAKVLDFGIAAVTGRAELEADGLLLGTPAYLAPERLTGDAVLPASDVYALGLLIYRVLAGRLPWSADTATQMVRAHTYVEPDPLPPLEGVPADVNTVTLRCLAKAPADRPAAAEVAEVLSSAAGITPPPQDDDRFLTPPSIGAFPVAMAPTEAAPSAGGLRAGRPGIVQRRTAAIVAVMVTLLVASTALLQSADRPGAAGPDSSPATPSRVEPADGARTPDAQPATGGAGPTGTAAPSHTSIGASEGTEPPPTPAGTTAPGVAAPTAADPPPGTPVTALGGVVRVQCAGSTARVLAVAPAVGYTVKDHDAGPANEVQVVLWSRTNESEIKVKCGPDGPEPKIKEDPQ